MTATPPETAAPAAADPTTSALGALNAKTRARQRMLLLGGGGTAAMLALWAVFGTGTSTTPKADAPTKIETDGLVNRDLSQREFVAIYGNRLDAQQRQIKALEDTRGDPKALQTQLDELAAQNAAMKADGAHTIDALTAENAALRQSAEAQAAANAAPPPKGGLAPVAAEAPDPLPQREVKTLNFTSASSDARPARGTRPAQGTLEVEDSPDYLPPNSYAPARVIVGVDASAGVASQTDPLPVVLRITGPARSVVKDGKLLSTRLQGCVVNGAATGVGKGEDALGAVHERLCFGKICTGAATLKPLAAVRCQGQATRAACDFGDCVGAKMPDNRIECCCNRGQRAELFDHHVARFNGGTAMDGMTVFIRHRL